MAGQPASFLGFGADGIALSSDSSELYFAPTGGSFLFSIPTAALKRQGPFSELRAQAAVTSLTQKGASDGFETDTNGFIYMGNAEQEAVIFWNPANATVSTFVRDPRINWIDTLSVGTDGYLYFTVNQLNFSPQSWPGTDRRVHPYVLFRAKLPNGGKKVV
jgi:sugar lactone lactonase YvrE